MRRLLFLLLLFSCITCFAQNRIDTLVKEGVDLNDRGYYEEALSKYDSALLLDNTSYLAAYEKAYTLMQLKRYDKAVDLCKQMLNKNQSSKNLSEVYILYGNALDQQGKKKESVEVYDAGIKSFPDAALLYYNKAITLFNMGEDEKAIEATKWALVKKPLHASSHKILTAVNKTNKAFSLMAALVFLAIEPQGERAKDQFDIVQKLLLAEAKKTGDNSYSVDIDPLTLLAGKKNKDDDFSSANMILSLSSAINVEEANKNETPPVRLQRNLKTLISALKEGQKEGKGFGWQFYVPFFIDLEKEGYVETLSHIALVTMDDAENNKWLSQNKDKVDSFYKWLKEYKWPAPKI